MYRFLYGNQLIYLILFFIKILGGYKMNFAEKIFTLRKGNDLTQEQLSEELNVS